MTRKNNRAKKDARARQKATGESYTTARRRTLKVRVFIPDHCANCLEPLFPVERSLFCSQRCQQEAELVRYWRGTTRDGRTADPGVQRALHTMLAHVLAGGYPRKARTLSAETRRFIVERDGGRCRSCGGPGEEVDHIAGDSNSATNLQLLCKDCHHAKTADNFVPADEESLLMIHQLEQTRILPDEPLLQCDDEHQWKATWRTLKKERLQRVIDEAESYGLHREAFRTQTDLFEAFDDLFWDLHAPDEPTSEDDDSGYGEGSYFANAMTKDD